MRVKDIAEKILSRYNRHRTALVKLGQIYCENLDILGRNIDNAKKLSKTVEDASTINAIPLFIGKFHIIPYDKSVLIDLTTVDFMNDVLSLNLDFACINSDMDTIINMYETLKPHLNKEENTKKFLEQLKQLRVFIEAVDKNTEEMLAKVQTLLKFKSPMIIRFIMLFMHKKAYNKKFDKLYPEMLIKVKEGRMQVIKKSQERLDRLFGASK